MWGDKRVSVVLMTYAERDSIRQVIEGFFDTGVVDEVLVVNNNAEPGTEEEIRNTRARQVFEPRQGYGHATRRGLLEASGDLIVLAEPDGTFVPEDIRKLLVYSEECDAVFGTRTTRELIWQGANMEWFLRWGNWAVAKVIEVLFNTSHLSDVGCTYRLLRRELGPPHRREHDRRRESRRGRDPAARDRIRHALRRGPGQLPAPRRGLLRHREAARGADGGPADDPAHRSLPGTDAEENAPPGGAGPRRAANQRGRP